MLAKSWKAPQAQKHQKNLRTYSYHDRCDYHTIHTPRRNDYIHLHTYHTEIGAMFA